MLTFKMFLQLWSPNTERPFPSPYGAALRAFLQALLCMGTYMYLVPRVPLSKFESLEYQKWGFWHRLGYMYLSGLTARWKYYFIWSISEVSVIISGLGFSGWATSGPSSDATPKWTRAKNVDIAKVELAKSGVELPMYWNISVSTWLRHCILYIILRVPKKVVISCGWPLHFVGGCCYFVRIYYMKGDSLDIVKSCFWKEKTLLLFIVYSSCF